MTFEEFKVGDEIELTAKSNAGTLKFKTNIAELDSRYILIPKITIENKTIGFSDPDCKVTLFCSKGEQLFVWENVEVKLVRYKNKICHCIYIPGDGKVHNRRGAFRLYIGEHVMLKMHTATEHISLKVLLKDISETGAAFITTEDLTINKVIRFRLSDNNFTLEVPATIVRKEPLKNNKGILYGCALIENIPRLNRYIARKQQQKLQEQTSVSLRVK